MEKLYSVNKTSSSVVYVEVFTSEEIDENVKPIGQASGFAYVNKQKIYIVTNWHVVTGRDFKSKKLNGLIPRWLKIKYMNIIGRDRGRVIWNDKGNEIVIKLYNPDNPNIPIWFEHPQQDVDVVVIPIDIGDITPINDFKTYYEIKEEVSDNIFIVGYPQGTVSSIGGIIPIWKGGTIATEPDCDYYGDGRNVFLLDTMGVGGMSGSPVILKRNFTSIYGDSLLNTTSYKLLGIISGGEPLNKTSEDDITLYFGKCWKKVLIDEIIEHNTLQ